MLDEAVYQSRGCTTPQVCQVLDETHGASPSASTRASAALSQWTRSPALVWSLGNAGAMLLSLLLPFQTQLQVTAGGFWSPFSPKVKCSIYPTAISRRFTVPTTL